MSNNLLESVFRSIIDESLLLEITADQAYEKFYSTMPREDFDAIISLGDKPDKPDKWIQFFLSQVRDRKCSVKKACNIINAVKSCDNLVRQKIKNKFATGEYSSVEDILNDLSYFSNGGTILSKKSFAKQGIEVIKENERWVVTCTTNYTANNHYYGIEGARWCTASDRNGMFDGYAQFGNYTNGGVLIQFKWKGNVDKSDEKTKPLPTDIHSYDISDFDPTEGYTGETLYGRDSIFQISIKPDGYVRDAENKYNKSCIGKSGIRTFVGQEMYSVLEDANLLTELVKKTDSFREAEKDLYLTAQERDAEKERQAREVLSTQARELNEEHEREINSAWRMFLVQNNIPIEELTKIVNENTPSEETHYAKVCNNAINMDDSDFSVLTLRAFSDKVWVVRRKEDADAELNPENRWELTTSNRPRTTNDVLKAAVLYNKSKSEVVCLLGIYNSRNGLGELETYSYDSHTKNGVTYNRFFSINKVGPDDDEMYLKSQIMVDLKTGRYVDATKFSHEVVRNGYYYYNVENIGGENYIFYSSNAYLILNFDNGTPVTLGDNSNAGDFCIGDDLYSNYACIFRLNNEQFLLSPGNGCYKIPEDKTVISIPDSRYETGNDCGPIYKLVFDDKTYNVYAINTRDFIFGICGDTNLMYKDYGILSIFGEKDGRPFELTFDGNDKYFITFINDRIRSKHRIPCDKYGNTPYEKNFKVHQQSGEFDQGEDWGRAAMRDWQDSDVPVKPLTDTQRENMGYYYDFITHTLMGDKDPEEAKRLTQQVINMCSNPEFNALPPEEKQKRLNAIIDKVAKGRYKLDLAGKPLEQPWDTENEIPAKLSDRPIREGLEKMKAIWKRIDEVKF